MTNLLNELGRVDFESLLMVMESYKKEAFDEDIFETGWNDRSGYVYIALENGVMIGSQFAKECEFIVHNPENGDEMFFETYKEAVDYLNNY